MRNELDNIVIQEPPIQELVKRKSCLKRGCLTGCGVIVIVLIASLALLKLASTPKIKKLKRVPENFPQAVPIYDKDEINEITLTYGKDRGRIVEMAAYAPKITLLPLIRALDKRYHFLFAAKNDEKEEPKWYDLTQILKEKSPDRRDTIRIEWNPLPAEPKFIQQYYMKKLEKNGFTVIKLNLQPAGPEFALQYHLSAPEEGGFTMDKPLSAPDVRNFSFEKDKIQGLFYIQDDPKKPGTDYFSLTIMSPPAE